MRLALPLALLALAACPSTPPSGTDVGHTRDAAHAGVDASAGATDASGPGVDAAGLDAAETGDAATAMDAAPPGSDAAEPRPDAAAPGPDAATIIDECDLGTGWCTGALTRHACVQTPTGRKWKDETCAAGFGCVNGACVDGACSDECLLGDTQAGRTCELLDAKAGTFGAPDPVGSMHDRARQYESWLRRSLLSAGGVGNGLFADPPAYTQLFQVDGLGDSAIWTGTWLAAESLRLMATGAPDAREAVRARVKTLHDWMSVSGDPGVLARFALPSNAYPAAHLTDLDCQNPGRQTHCKFPYGGAAWDWLGHISRDQYQGVILGYSVAYDALGPEDEDARSVIRDDVVTLVQQLMLDRQVPMKVTINGIPISTSVTLRFVVLCSSEMASGNAVEFTVDVNKPDNADMWGFQEFTPDLADIVHQIPGFGWVPAIPRSSSAIMLASFFQVALQVTRDVPARAADRAAILDYYLHHTGTGGNIDDWLKVALQWTSSNTDCNPSYYGNNITMEPLYDLARLEDDPARSQKIRGDLLDGKLWPAFVTAKNSFFAYIEASQAPAPDPAVAATALTQLAQFPVAPRIHHGVDHRTDPRYPHSATCTDQVDHSTAVDVGDRVVDDFIWQRQPWSLFDWGDERQLYPGVDYLVAYWMARRHGLTGDDSAGHCAAWH